MVKHSPRIRYPRKTSRSPSIFVPRILSKCAINNFIGRVRPSRMQRASDSAERHYRNVRLCTSVNSACDAISPWKPASKQRRSAFVENLHNCRPTESLVGNRLDATRRIDTRNFLIVRVILRYTAARRETLGTLFATFCIFTHDRARVVVRRKRLHSQDPACYARNFGNE